MKNTILAVMVMLLVNTSCKKDSTDGASSGSRTLRYELSGNFAGTLFVSYTTAAGGTATEQITALPANKEITYNSNVTAAVMAVAGNGGNTGQQITVIVKRGGQQISSTTFTAGTSGSFTGSTPTVTF